MRIESQLQHYHLVVLSLAEIQIQAFYLLKLVMIFIRVLLVLRLSIGKFDQMNMCSK